MDKVVLGRGQENRKEGRRGGVKLGEGKNGIHHRERV